MKKLLMAVITVVLIAVISVSATLAYLTDTEDVVNTFTVGLVNISLDEAEVDKYGVAEDKDNKRTGEGNEYKLIPGHTYVKDPIIRVDDDSENCWLFVKVENDIAGIEAETTIANQMTTNGWDPVAGETNVYAYESIVIADSDVKVFENFTIKSDIDNADIEDYAGKTVEVTAYAVQADGFATAADAWAAAKDNITAYNPAP